MNQPRHEPWSLLGQFDRFFAPPHRRSSSEQSPAPPSDWAPAVDIQEKMDRFIIRADIPGVDPKAIEVRMENGILTIKGERAPEPRGSHEGFRRIERRHGGFQRRFSLPDTANAEGVTATSQHGVLEVVIPKQQKSQPRRIEVTS